MGSSFNKLHLVRQIDLFTLKLFLTVVEERQISRAAARENIAASSATKRIQDLEDIAGLKLLERHPKGVVPSPAGEVIAKHFREIFDSLESIRVDLGTFLEGVRGSVRVTSTPSVIMRFLAREIADFAHDFPMVEVELKENVNPNALRALVSGDVDVAVFVAAPDLVLDAVDAIEYRSDRLVAVVPRGHALGERASVTFEELLVEPLIAISASTTMMGALRATAKRLGHELRPKYTVDTAGVASSLVQAGLGVTIQPEHMLSIEDLERVATVPLDEPWARRSLQVATLRGRVQSAATQAFVSQLLDRPGTQGGAG